MTIERVISNLFALKNFHLYIQADKEECAKESINCKDEFIDQSYFQWETPNSTTQTSDRGKDIILNNDRGVSLHLFVRKYREIDVKSEPYIYIGKGNTVEYLGEKPITVKLELENEVPASLYDEFVQKV
ncbi:DUF3427 domain-containing protein [Priestia filamentosa]|nr:DUF3427 domain-containing protein [Priestia filamentosa]